MTAYLRNCWYVASFADQLRSDSAMARTILGQRTALFRDEHGAPAALADRCPHRFAQLHMGILNRGVLECPYHGLCFNTAGQCVHNPHGDGVIPSGAQIRRFPVVERHGAIWIWPGEADLADSSTIPDLEILASDEPNAVSRGYMHTNANYELVTDNLMDLSHADYIHKDSLNTGGSLSKIRPRVQARENSVHAHWGYETDNIQPFFLSTMRNPEGRGVQSFDMTWFPPSNLLLIITARDVDLAPEHDAVFATAHLLTPESDTSCHYHFVGIRNWETPSPMVNKAITDGVMAAFINEDKPALDAVQESMQTTDLWSLKPILLSCDPGPVHARRMLQRLIAAEHARSLVTRLA